MKVEKSKGVFTSYKIEGNHYDEVFEGDSSARSHYNILFKQFNQLGFRDFKELSEYAKVSFYNQGITFAVYSDEQRGVERIMPFDLFPRIIPNKEWEILESGVFQRNTAINLFLHDIYNGKKIFKDKIVPSELILSAKYYFKEMEGIKPVGGIYNHVSGTDIIKHNDGKFYILEDNVRCPSGVSYVIANRIAMKKTVPNLLRNYKVHSVEEYPEQLLEIMQSVAPEGLDNPTCVVLSPGMYNSAYYEHSFLALNMGIQLVEGRDLFVEKKFVYMKTIHGPKRVDVIYRRVDDDFLDPKVWRKDSVLGVSGIISAYKEGNVSLLNAPGCGAADDKAVYSYIPAIIKYYLNEEPILNNVHTYRCELDDDYKYVLENMHNLVIKPVDESGGYGIMIGPKATKTELSDYKKLIAANRRKYIAQPVLSLSMHSTFIDETECFEPRHIDLRTYCLMGKNKKFLVKGGLSRVALKRGNLIVNSSQGGGAKDSWVLEE
ncbi:MAG: circularly permuted type 2 ATP-grasp protein [Opitutaceae bacterium]|nr:circularly permuted type 2 ATP-grasp protein [Cytophagales bacterium]